MALNVAWLCEGFSKRHVGQVAAGHVGDEVLLLMQDYKLAAPERWCALFAPLLLTKESCTDARP
jgi:hypothetical protein